MVEGDSHHDSILAEIVSISSIDFHDFRYAPSSFFADMQLHENLRQLLIHGYGLAGEESFHRLPGRKRAARKDFYTVRIDREHWLIA